MTKSHGKRSGTRSIFKAKKKSNLDITANMKVFRIGDVVNINPNPLYTKGLPPRYYVGRTGKVFDVRLKSLGVLVNKNVGGKKMEKMIYLRPEHLKHTKITLKKGKEESRSCHQYPEKKAKIILKPGKFKIIEPIVEVFENKYLRRCDVNK